MKENRGSKLKPVTKEQDGGLRECEQIVTESLKADVNSRGPEKHPR